MLNFIKKIFHVHKYKILQSAYMSNAYCKVTKKCNDCNYEIESIVHHTVVKADVESRIQQPVSEMDRNDTRYFARKEKITELEK